MCVGGVDHIKVSPDKRTVGRCERNLWVLALHQMFMNVDITSVIARTTSRTDHKA